MESERITLTNCPHELKKSVDAISILVVDDDTTSLSIIAAILKKFEYEVVTVKHANDALCTLRIKSGAFDLVVSDVHMPDMDGFELQQAIAQEFNNLPVVLMSADDEEAVALKGLESGAAFFICKPVCPDDVRDLWQFAAMKKTNKVVIEETGEKNICNETTIISVSSSSVDEDRVSNKDSKNKSPTNEGSDEKKGETSSQKKPKIIWTNSLHNRFLEAIRSIGLDRAVPKKILEVMDVPGLTRENVASHLQKYRIFLRRVSDASYKIQYSADHKSLSRNLFKPSLESSSPASTSPSTLMLNRFTKFPYQKPGQYTFPISLPNSGASSSSLTNQYGSFGQSRLLSNKGNPAGLNLNISNTLINHPINTFQGHISNITPEGLSSAQSATINPIHATSMPISNNPAYQTNYMGYNISNLKLQGLNNFGHVTIEPNSADNYTNINGGGEQLSDYPVMQNLPLHHSGTVGNGGGIMHGSGYSPMFDMLEFGTLSGQQPVDDVDFNANLGDQVNIPNQAQQNGGENLRTSNPYGTVNHWENSVPSLDQAHNQQYCSQNLVRFQEFGTSSQLNDTIVVTPNEQVREGSSLTNTQGFGTSAQLLSKTLLSPVERDDDDFLESLLGPFGEDLLLQ
ncbi:hypothetical protein CASFOL_010450 [Castilleja foliolosa]|uniref:Two-component response regulator n=1 Tax=Castilleja foliolosa TaxID=1961234 RepID=A0ABD3DSK7_9LAMI